MEKRLNFKVTAPESSKVVVFTTYQQSVEVYETSISRKYPNLPAVEYDEDGFPLNISRFTQKRVEFELAKQGFVYNYSRLDYARSALRQVISKGGKTPSPLHQDRARSQLTVRGKVFRRIHRPSSGPPPKRTTLSDIRRPRS